MVTVNLMVTVMTGSYHYNSKRDGDDGVISYGDGDDGVISL